MELVRIDLKPILEDIVDGTLETTTELNTRSTNDRARGNHTGTQSITTITETDTAKIMTSAERDKLTGIEANATADQTSAEIKALYESEGNTNAYADTDKTKVGHITVTQAIDLDSMKTDVAANKTKVTNVTTDLSLGTNNGTTLVVESSDGTDVTLPAAADTVAGLFSSADKNKLDGVEVNAKDDQIASEVNSNAGGNLASTNVQAALEELQSKIDTINEGEW